MRTRLPATNDEWKSRLRTGPAVCAVGGDAVRLFHLAENLRLADDEGVEARGHAEQMARRVEVGDWYMCGEMSARFTPLNVADEGDEVGSRALPHRRQAA